MGTSGRFSTKAAAVAVHSEDERLIRDQSRPLPVPLRLHHRAARVVIGVGIRIHTRMGTLAVLSSGTETRLRLTLDKVKLPQVDVCAKERMTFERYLDERVSGLVDICW